MNSINEIFTFLKDLLNESEEEDDRNTYDFLKKLYRIKI